LIDQFKRKTEFEASFLQMPVDNFYRLIFDPHRKILTKAFMTTRRFQYRRRSSFPKLRNGQGGQALIYGIFILTISLAALFFLF
jgi:hypothetical protein